MKKDNLPTDEEILRLIEKREAEIEAFKKILENLFEKPWNKKK